MHFRFEAALGNSTHVNTALYGNVNIDPAGVINFGATTRQMLNLWNANYGIGVQNNAMYFRSDGWFEWYRLGTHNNIAMDAANGTWLMGLSTSGLSVNGTFVSASDRNAKENFATIDAKAVLDKVVKLPLSAWNYKSDEKKTRHLGPMAQDFFAAFNVGPDDKHIATVDESGVALAAIQGLNAKLEGIVKEQAQKIAALEKRQDLQAHNAEVGQLRAQVAELQRTVKVLLSRTAPDGELALLH